MIGETMVIDFTSVASATFQTLSSRALPNLSASVQTATSAPSGDKATTVARFEWMAAGIVFVVSRVAKSQIFTASFSELETVASSGAADANDQAMIPGYSITAATPV